MVGMRAVLVLTMATGALAAIPLLPHEVEPSKGLIGASTYPHPKLHLPPGILKKELPVFEQHEPKMGLSRESLPTRPVAMLRPEYARPVSELKGPSKGLITGSEVHPTLHLGSLPVLERHEPEIGNSRESLPTLPVAMLKPRPKPLYAVHEAEGPKMGLLPESHPLLKLKPNYIAHPKIALEKREDNLYTAEENKVPAAAAAAPPSQHLSATHGPCAAAGFGRWRTRRQKSWPQSRPNGPW